TGHAAATVLKKLSALANREITSVVVAVSGVHVEGTNGQGIKTIAPRGRTITNHDVMEVVNHSRTVMFPPDRELFQALPREFRIDGQRGILRPVGMCGGRLEVSTYLVSGQIAHLQNLERA
ncbi:MAG: cell division protein FtsA, partial [Armatimonadota bacterium]